MKTAASRLTKEILKGRLSQKALMRVSNLTPNAKRLTDGLNKGSDAIAKRLGVTVHETSGREVAKDAIGSIAHGVREALKSKSITSGRDAAIQAGKASNVAGRGHSFLMAMHGGGGLAIGDNVFLRKRQKLFEQLGSKKGLAAKILDKVKGRDISKQDQGLISAIVKRHEIDEQRALKNLKSHGHKYKQHFGPIKDGDGLFGKDMRKRMGAHQDPFVLSQESRNVTMASPAVKKIMQTARDVTGEAKMMANSGHVYGHSNPVSRSSIKKMHGSMSSQSLAPSLGPYVYSERAIRVLKKINPELEKVISRG